MDLINLPLKRFRRSSYRNTWSLIAEFIHRRLLIVGIYNSIGSIGSSGSSGSSDSSQFGIVTTHDVASYRFLTRKDPAYVGARSRKCRDTYISKLKRSYAIYRFA